jgi:hypothetical protein
MMAYRKLKSIRSIQILWLQGNHIYYRSGLVIDLTERRKVEISRLLRSVRLVAEKSCPYTGAQVTAAEAERSRAI